MTKVGVSHRRLWGLLVLAVVWGGCAHAQGNYAAFSNRLSRSLSTHHNNIPTSIANILENPSQPHPQYQHENYDGEPMMMESRTTATFHLPTDDEMPSINAKPVLELHNHEEDHTPLLNSQEAMNSIRHRRRLMLHVPETKQSGKSTPPPNHTLRPPKDFIIYSLPEQSFWPKGHLGSQPPPQPTENEEGTSSSEEEQEPSSTTSPSVSTTQRSIFLGNHSSSTFQTTPTPPPAVVTPSPDTATPPSPSRPRAEAHSSKKLEMTLPEKKQHLGQCMRYCMDAIL